MTTDLEPGVDSNTDPFQHYLPRLVMHWDSDAPGSSHRQIEGTMVFADISGFTAMSERLAGYGKLGAEEVTQVLGNCFEALLAVAYAHGGRLIKFGGDALLILFDDDEHQHRALNAAAGMQDAMSRVGQVRTSAGSARLQMSIGAHSGSFHFFLVGTSHRELILTGPDATRTVEMEAAADATEIVVSPEMAAALPPYVVAGPKGPGFLATSEIDATPGGTTDIRTPAVDLEQFIPVALRESLRSRASEPEHRQVTVAFVHFTGIDNLLAREGADLVGDVLALLVDRIQAAIDPRQVAFLATDIYGDGGKIILTAGAPTATGNDSERMLLALRGIIACDQPLKLRIGVNRGHVFAGDVGPDYRRTYTVMGDDVNLAARLMSAASNGEIYATPEVLDGSRTLFETRPLEPFSVKGKAEPVHALLVGAETGVRTTRAREDLPFRGRLDELAVLNRALQRIRREEKGDVIAVIGDRGIGKTRLMQEAISLDADLPQLTVRAEPYGATSPYRPFRDPIRKILGIEKGTQKEMARQLRAAVRRVDPDLLPLLPLVADVVNIDVPTTPEVDVLDSQFRIDRVAEVLIRIISHERPRALLLLLEECQLMDEASSELSARLCHATRDHPWLVVTTRTGADEGFEPEGSPVLALEPLSAEESSDIVVAVTADRPLRPSDIATIVRRSGGNPLFLEELLAVVQEQGSVADLPDSLDALVSAQIDSLPTVPRQLLRYASVLGRSFRVTVLDEVLAGTSITMDATALSSLVGFLTPDGPDRLRFRHGLIHDVAYEGLSYRRRRELHSKAARVIEALAGEDTRSVADLLALHYHLGQDFEATWRYARMAGDDARTAYANIDAATQYGRALDAAKRLKGINREDKASVWERLGEMREQAGFYIEALDAFKRASALLGHDPIARSELMLKRALARMRSGDYSQALREVSRGLRSLREHDGLEADRARARLLASRAVIRGAQQRPRETLASALEALDVALTVGEEEALARVYTVLDWAYLVLGQPQEAVYGCLALEIYERRGQLDEAAHVLNNLGGMSYYEGRWGTAVNWYEKGKDAFSRAGNDAGAALAGANIGEVLVSQNRLDAAEPLLRDATRVLRATGGDDDAPFAEIQLARLLVERGDYLEAHALLEKLRDEATTLGQPVNALEASLYLARLKIRQGDPTGALALLDLAKKAAGGDAVVFASALAREEAAALAALGDVDGAHRRLGEGLEEARRQSLPYEEAQLLKLEIDLTRLEGREPSSDVVQDAEALNERLGILT